MPTRAELRNALRQRLEDVTAAPLWDDPALNEALAAAIRGYGARFPRQATATLTVAAGATRVTVPAEIDPATIARVIDSTGAALPRLSSDTSPPFGHERQAWRWWNGDLILGRAAIGGTWQIEYLAPRIVPSDDVTAVDLLPGDEEIVLALASATALRRRQGEDANRGLRPDSIAALVAAIEATAERLMSQRRHRAHGGWLARE